MTHELILPLTLLEREELGEDVEIRVPASFEEYLELVEDCEYNIEYFNGEIISMGNASYYHEKLVMLIGAALRKTLPSNCTILGSNIKIHVEDVLGKANFNADVSVVEGEPEFLVLPTGKNATNTILNPVVVVEVTSRSTIAHDYGDKLMAYKKIGSLKQVIFVSQYENSVTVYERQGLHTWLSTDYVSVEDSFLVLGATVQLKEIYQ